MSDTVSDRSTSEQMEVEDQRMVARQKKANWRGHSGLASSGLSAPAKKEQNYTLIKKEGVLVTPPCSRCDTPARRDKGILCIMAVGLSSRCAECYKHNYVCDRKDWIPPPGQPRPVEVAAQALAQLAQGTRKSQASPQNIDGAGVQGMSGAAAQNKQGLSAEDVLSPRMGRLTVNQKRTPLPSGPPINMEEVSANQQRTPLPSGPPSRGRGSAGLQQARPAESGAGSPQNLGVGLRPHNDPTSGGPSRLLRQGQCQYNTPTRLGAIGMMPTASGPQNGATAPLNRQINLPSPEVQPGSPFTNGCEGGMNVLTSGFTPGSQRQRISAPQTGAMNSSSSNNGFQQARLGRQQASAPLGNGFPPVGTFTTPSQLRLQPAHPNQQGPVPHNGFHRARPLTQGRPAQVLAPQPLGSNYQLRRSASQQFNLLSYSAFPEQNLVVEINSPGQFPAFEVVVDGVRHYAAILAPIRGDSPMIGQRHLQGQQRGMGE